MTAKGVVATVGVLLIGIVLAIFSSSGAREEGLVVLIGVASQPSLKPDEKAFPARYIGTFRTKEKKEYLRRAISVVAVAPSVAEELTGSEGASHSLIVGPGLPPRWNPETLRQWNRNLTPWASASVPVFRSDVRLFKWTILLVGHTDAGTPCWLILTRNWHSARLRRWLTPAQRKALVSIRSPFKRNDQFWLSLFSLALILLSGHLLLTKFWSDLAVKRFPDLLLVREKGIYHSLTAVFFAFYLTSCFVLHTRFDFQDSVFIPPHIFSDPVSAGLLTPLINWAVTVVVQTVTIAVPSWLIPPAGIVIGHMRGMVEQAWTTAPTLTLPPLPGLLQAFAAFFQGESTIVAMMHSALLTRAVIFPEAFGTRSYGQAYLRAIKTLGALFPFMALLSGPASLLFLLSRCV